MCLLAQFPLPIQSQILSCCDSSGVVVNDDRLVEIVAKHAPDMLASHWADRLVDLVCELWQERRQQNAAAASN